MPRSFLDFLEDLEVVLLGFCGARSTIGGGSGLLLCGGAKVSLKISGGDVTDACRAGRAGDSVSICSSSESKRGCWARFRGTMFEGEDGIFSVCDAWTWSTGVANLRLRELGFLVEDEEALLARV